MHRELHEESLHLIEQALGNVKLLENRMRPEDYEDIIRRYGDMKVWVLLHQEEYEAYIRLLIQRKDSFGAKPGHGGKNRLCGWVRWQSGSDPGR